MKPGPHTISITRPAIVSDATQGETPAPSPVVDTSSNPLTAISGVYIQPASGASRAGFGRADTQVSDEMICSRDVSAAKKGDIVMDEGGKTYLVQWVADEAGMGRAWTIFALARG